MTGRLLTVTGDDFGAETAANEAIAACWDHGVLTHASLMVSEPAAKQAVALARECPGLSVGLHLVLCDGLATGAPDDVAALTDTAGRFPRDPTQVGLALWWNRRRLRSVLEREVRAQIERYLETGLRLDHVDGHHHLHTHPVVFEILLRCLDEYNIPRVRLVHEDKIARTPEAGWREELVPSVHAVLSHWHRWRFRRRGLRVPERRVYGLRRNGRIDEPYLLWLIPRLRADQVEIYAHPGRGEGGQREREALCSTRVREAIARAGYALARSDLPLVCETPRRENAVGTGDT